MEASKRKPHNYRTSYSSHDGIDKFLIKTLKEEIEAAIENVCIHENIMKKVIDPGHVLTTLLEHVKVVLTTKNSKDRLVASLLRGVLFK